MSTVPSGSDDQGESASRRRRLRNVLIAFVPAAAFIALLAFGFLKQASVKGGAGERAPSFELPLLDKSRTFSSSELEGKVVVINFWASWCIPCREEALVLEAAWRRYRDQGVVFVGIDIQDAQQDAEDFVKEFKITYPIVRDVEEKVSRAYGVRGLPETYFIGRNGRFGRPYAGSELDRERGNVIRGPIDESILRRRIEELLQQPSASK